MYYCFIVGCRWFELLRQNPEISLPIINETYVSEILSLSIENFSFYKVKNAMNFHQNLMAYCDFEHDINSEENTMNRSWSSCAHKLCLDCCMYRKAQELSRSNIIFLAETPRNVTAWRSSCGYDCW